MNENNTPDEDADQDDPKCPFCGSADGCDHHVTSFDFQYGDIFAGFLEDGERMSEWIDMIHAAFLAAHKAKSKKPTFSTCRPLMALWRGSELTEDEDEPVSFSTPGVYRFLANLLREAGASGETHELNQGPCFSTEACDLFARDPEKVADKCGKLLKQRLAGKRV